MKIRHFELESPDEIGLNINFTPRHLFYYDKHNILNAWTIDKKKSNKSMIKAYQEVEAGKMDIVDIVELDTPNHFSNINIQGVLSLKTISGTLQIYLKDRKIQLIGTRTHLFPQERAIKDQDNLFSGMEITDQCTINNTCIKRYESRARDFYGDLFFEEQILLATTKSNDKLGHDINQLLLGHSRLDNQCNLVKSMGINIFDIPICHFVMEYKRDIEELTIIGWNNQALQTTRISPQLTSRSPTLAVQEKWSTSLKNTKLKDKSTYYTQQDSRLAILMNTDRPYQFYCLEKRL